MRSLRVGAPESSHSVQMGPVVDAEAMQRRAVVRVHAHHDRDVGHERGIEAQLPAQAIARLGLLSGQENVLLRVVLRDCSRSITAAEANAVYQRIQTALHEGSPGAGYKMDLHQG